MIPGFVFTHPSKFLFGKGKISALGEECRPFGTKALVVTSGDDMDRCGILKKAIDALAGVGIAAYLFNGITPNPKTSEINAGAEAARTAGAQVVIGLGGGSAIDGAKATAVVAGCGGNVEDYLYDAQKDKAATLPIIAIPTTAGTGSELSRGAIISDAARSFKGGLRGNEVLARVAIVDPELTISVPKRVTAETGFDVLCHAVETYVSRKAQPITEMFSEKAIAIVGECLLPVVEDGSNIEARTAMSFASALMGCNLCNSSNCLPHRMQYPIGARTNTSHAAGLAALFPGWLERSYRSAPVKFATIARLLGESEDLPTEDMARRGAKRIVSCMDTLGLRIGLRDLGITEDELCALCADVKGDLSANPWAVEVADMDALYREAF